MTKPDDPTYNPFLDPEHVLSDDGTPSDDSPTDELPLVPPPQVEMEFAKPRPANSPLLRNLERLMESMRNRTNDREMRR